MLEIGDVAPEFYLENQQAEVLGLPDILAGANYALLIFLRHLG
jgi:hypothetical protein